MVIRNYFYTREVSLVATPSNPKRRYLLDHAAIILFARSPRCIGRHLGSGRLLPRLGTKGYFDKRIHPNKITARKIQRTRPTVRGTAPPTRIRVVCAFAITVAPSKPSPSPAKIGIHHATETTTGYLIQSQPRSTWEFSYIQFPHRGWPKRRASCDMMAHVPNANMLLETTSP